jgi:ubiquinone/menaquinone biosynthesis C-methylase UbiE
LIQNPKVERMLAATAAAEERHFWFRGLRRTARWLIGRALGATRPTLIIDCGAGTGRNLEWLADLGPAVGVERSPAGLRVGRAHGRRLVRASVTHLPFADESADVATSFDVLYCLDDASERQAVREMYRVLKPGGFALVNAAALDVLHGSHSALTLEVRRYTRPRLRSVLTGAGFAIERMTFTNMSTFPATLAVRWVERVTGRAEKASDADLRVPVWPVNAAFNAALAIEAGLLRVTNLPIGTSLLCVARKTRKH